MLLNSRERTLRTLEIKEPDRVPITELDIEIPLMEAITGSKYPGTTSLQTQVSVNRELEKKKAEFEIDCYVKIGFDLIVADLSAPEHWKPELNPDGTMTDLWGRVLMLDQQTRAWVPLGTVFNKTEDFSNFDFPDPCATGWTFATECMRKIVKEERALATFIRDPFAQAWEMFTPMNFVKWMYLEPKLVRKALESLTEFNVRIIGQLADAGADFIISGGDYCEEKGPMVPVEFFDDVIFPSLRKQVDAAHRHGLKLVKHTDGNINPILKGLASIVDGLHSLDPTAKVDIGEVKQQYGKTLVLIGNVAVDSLAKKSEKEVAGETEMCIKKASPGGGHILSSSNSWASGAKLKNCLTMVETGRKFGVYPIGV